VTYRFVEHTAELELQLEAGSPEELFLDALTAFAELVADEDGGEPAEYEVELSAADRAGLLVQWLEELIFFAETRGFVPETAELELGESTLRAKLRGRRGDPSHLVKAVTYHGLELVHDQNRWRARLVLDV
jgi:SHS2 domain-containing protein